jgi:two-component system chemotaxis response regulator CheB
MVRKGSTPVPDFRSFDAQTGWIVAIGASGSQGLDDIKALLRELPCNTAGIIMVVLHRPWHHLSYLHAILTNATALPVIIAADGEHLETGTVYIGEPSQHMTLGADKCCKVIDDPDRNHGNRTIDLLFKSVAANAGPQMIGVILSGTLDDGSRGLAAIHDAGGITMVRSPSNPPGDAMPKSAIKFGSSAISKPSLLASARPAAEKTRRLDGQLLKRKKINRLSRATNASLGRRDHRLKSWSARAS